MLLGQEERRQDSHRVGLLGVEVNPGLASEVTRTGKTDFSRANDRS